MAAQLIILLLNPVIGALLSITFLGLWHFRRAQRHLAVAGIGYALSTLGFVMQGVLPALPYELQRIPGNLLFLLAAAMLFAAVLGGLRIAVPVRTMAALIIAGMVALMWFLWVDPSLPTRTIIISLALAGLALTAAVKLYQYPKQRKADWFLFWVATLATMDFLMRPVLVFAFPEQFVGEQILQQTVYWVWVQVFYAVLAITVALGLFAALSSDVVEELRREADTDKLSGLYNRRGFENQARRVLWHYQTTRSPVALVIADLDHFKRINDTYGHAAGDAVITAFSEQILQLLPGAAVAGRIGGEEFAVLLPGLDLSRAEEFAQALQAGMAQHCNNESFGALVPTASMGLAVAHGEAELSDLLRRADAALYQAKDAGRNRVCALAFN